MKTQQGRVAEDGKECKDAAGKPILPCAATCKDADGKYVRSSAYVNMFGFKDYKGGLRAPVDSWPEKWQTMWKKYH